MTTICRLLSLVSVIALSLILNPTTGFSQQNPTTGLSLQREICKGLSDVLDHHIRGLSNFLKGIETLDYSKFSPNLSADLASAANKSEISKQIMVKATRDYISDMDDFAYQVKVCNR
jgi:hypothetical protein